MYHRSLFVFCCFALCAFIGCENEVDTTPNNLPQKETSEDTAGADGAADTGLGDVDVSGQCADCPIADTWYRFTSLTVLEVDNDVRHAAAISLNGEWGQDIEKNELNILLHVLESTPGEVRFEVLNGARVGTDGTYCTLPDSLSFVVDKTGCGVESAAPFQIAIFAGSEESPKTCAPQVAIPNTVPLSETTFVGEINADCDVIRGEVNGGVDVSALQKSCSCLFLGAEDYSDACGTISASAAPTESSCEGCGLDGKYQSLYTSLSALAVRGFAKCTNAAGEPSVCIKAEFEATPVAAPTPCP